MSHNSCPVTIQLIQSLCSVQDLKTATETTDHARRAQMERLLQRQIPFWSRRRGSPCQSFAWEQWRIIWNRFKMRRRNCVFPSLLSTSCLPMDMRWKDWLGLHSRWSRIHSSETVYVGQAIYYVTLFSSWEQKRFRRRNLFDIRAGEYTCRQCLGTHYKLP